MLIKYGGVGWGESWVNGISGGGGGGGWGGMPGVWELSEWDQKLISFMVANIF